jgi:metacaspase-1
MKEDNTKNKIPRRALLIAVNGYADRPKYDTAKHWWNLNTTADVLLVKQALIARGFKEKEDILILQTKTETTKANILLTARKWLKEFAQKNPGAVLYLHYSGHGGQTKSIDPNKPDGLDQLLIPSDAISRTEHGNDIRGQEVGRLLTELMSCKPSDLFVSFDCCYAGRNTRGGGGSGGLVRGESSRGIVPIQRGGGDEKKDEPAFKLFAPSKGFVVMAATQSDESDTETIDDNGNPIGPLSYALAKALTNAPKDASYRSLFESVKTIMYRQVPKQTPLIEGPVGTEVFNGNLAPRTRTIVVGVSAKDGLQLKEGLLMGVTKGSKVDLRLTEATTEPAIASAVVEDTYPLMANLKVIKGDAARLVRAGKGDNKAAPPVLPRPIYGVITERTYPDTLLKVRVGNLSGHPNEKEIRGILTKMATEQKLIELMDANATSAGKWQIEITRGKGNSILLTRSDSSVVILNEKERLPLAVESALGNEVRRQALLSLENSESNSALNVEFRFVPVEPDFDQAGLLRGIKQELPIPIVRGGRTEFSTGTYLMLQLRNMGNTKAWVTVINLRVDGSIGPVYPALNEKTDNSLPFNPEIKVEDRPWTTPKIRGKIPYVIEITDGNGMGTEAYKMIVTDSPADLSSLVDDEAISRGEVKGTGRGKGEHPIATLLARATTIQRTTLKGRGAPTSIASTASWSTSTLPVVITKK